MLVEGNVPEIYFPIIVEYPVDIDSSKLWKVLLLDNSSNYAREPEVSSWICK